jgi:hypothetical protein
MSLKADPKGIRINPEWVCNILDYPLTIYFSIIALFPGFPFAVPGLIGRL